MSLLALKAEIKSCADAKRAKVLQGFFKTGPGQYGQGDIFLGITVPKSRKIAQKYHYLKLEDVENLIRSKIHEERLIALLILVHKFKTGTQEKQTKIYNFYLKQTKFINNWDLVDLSAPNIVGKYLENKPKEILVKLAKSKDLWEKRIAIIATYEFIRNSDFKYTLEIAKILLTDNHDLIHKAVGWMLREVGKKDQKAEEEFLKKHYKTMPRTALRYSIERFDPKLKLAYLKGNI